MNINFKDVHIENFLSLGTVDIQLNNRSYTLISGVNNNPTDNAKSNGSGKSSISDAIMWALTGETVRGITKNITNIHTTGGTAVELTLTIDNKEYRICRYKDHDKYKTNLKIYIDGEDKSGKSIRDGEKLLEEYLPDLTSNLIGSVIILGQGLPQRFSNNTPAGRKEILEKLSKSDFMIEDIKNKLTTRKISLSSQIKDTDNKILVSNTNITNYKLQLEDNINKLNSLEEETALDSKIKDIGVKIEELESNKVQLNEKLNDKQKELDSLQQEIFNIKNKIYEETSNVNEKYQKETSLLNESLLNLNTELNNFLIKKQNAKNNLTESYNKDNSSLQSQKIQLQLKINAYKQDIKAKKEIKDICPTCGQKLPNVIKPDTTELECNLDKSIQELQEIEDKINNYKDNYNLDLNNIENTFNNDKSQIDNNIQEIKSKLNNLSQLQTQEINDINNKYKDKNLINESNIQNIKYTISDLKVQLDTNEKELNTNKLNLNLTIESKNQLKNKKEELNNNVLKFNSLIAKAEEDIVYDTNVRDNLQNRQDVINKMYTIATRDFRGYLLQNTIQYINKKAKEYSKEIFDNENIEFVLDGNNLDILYDNKYYANLSGGEKQKIDLIIQFSIRDMLCNMMNFSSNILFLDEIFDGLDSQGCDKVLNLISNKLHDIESVFIISHHGNEINIPYDNEIIVMKNKDGVSTIK